MDLRKFHPPFCQKNGFRSSSPHPKNTCGFPSPATPKTRIGFVSFSFTTHKVYEFHFPQHHDLKICAPPVSKHNIAFVSLSAMAQNAYLFCSPQLHDMKYFDPSLSQFAPKICRFLFPHPCRPKSSALRFPQPQDSKTIPVFVSLSLTI